jgi:glycosyltransferase involved in cell wall biosynthesis
MQWFRRREKKRARALLKIPPNRKVIFTLGRIDPRKGLDLLLKAIAAMRAGGSSPARVHKDKVMVIIGGGAKKPHEREKAEKARLLEMVRNLGLEDAVKFTGYLPDGIVPWYYAAADVFVVPSRYEPFGLTILEAMACGTAVVATKHGGPAHIISNGKNGILIDPLDTSDFAEGVLQLLDDAALREELAANAIAECVRKYSWKAVIKRYLCCAEKVAAAAAPS